MVRKASSHRDKFNNTSHDTEEHVSLLAQSKPLNEACSDPEYATLLSSFEVPLADMAVAKSPNIKLHSDEAGESSSKHSDSVLDSISPAYMRQTPTLDRSVSRITTRSTIEYKVYKRRFFGLFQLVLLNIVVSWDWIAFAPVSDTASQYFNTTQSVINWVSTAFLFAFVAATPFTFWALNKHGPKLSIIIAACLLLVGNWIKYGGTKSNHFGVVMFGQMLIGLAQPFVLSAPTSYSNLWFSPAGRTTATALASLSNPFGAALGQLISPFWANKPSDIPNMILYISIISSVACIPAFFIPHHPPTPPSAGATATHLTHVRTLTGEAVELLYSPEFYLIFIPFAVYVGFFNAFSSLLNQILEPYGFSEDNAGIAGAVLIVVGLVSAAISSPLIDKYKPYLWYVRCSVPIIALSYLIFIWAPGSHSLGYVFVICALLGAASFGLVPVALEFLVEMHYPLGPELSSSLCWCGGQLLGGIFIVIMDAMKAGPDGEPKNNMRRALWFQAIIGMIVMPVPLCLGLFGRQAFVRSKRWEADREGAERGVVEGAPEEVEPPFVDEERPMTNETIDSSNTPIRGRNMV